MVIIIYHDGKLMDASLTNMISREKPASAIPQVRMPCPPKAGFLLRLFVATAPQTKAIGAKTIGRNSKESIPETKVNTANGSVADPASMGSRPSEVESC